MIWPFNKIRFSMRCYHFNHEVLDQVVSNEKWNEQTGVYCNQIIFCNDCRRRFRRYRYGAGDWYTYEATEKDTL